jgi:ribosomal protein S12 methylthiotransferase accessory factor
MESIEQATWERFSPPPRWETLSGMRGERFISPAELADAVYGPVSVDTVLPWIDVRDIVSGAVFWVPHDTICVQRLGSYRKAARWAYASTNGLASGNSIGEACLHGLLEVIERDAETCADHLMEHEAVPRPRIDTATFGAPYVKELIEKVNSAGLGLLIFSNENPFAICCYSAYLEDRDTLFHTNVGHGAHLDPNVAAARAITEAAQGRITMISGTREDNARADYRVLHEVGESLLRRGRYEAELAGATVPAAAPMTLPRRLHGMLAIVVDRLRSEGFTRILQREITDEKIGVPVVKVLVPGLSGYHRPLAQRMESYRAWKSSVARA